MVVQLRVNVLHRFKTLQELSFNISHSQPAMMVLWKQFEVLISILMWFYKTVWKEAVAV